ncbi:phosphoglucomutase/phosphomannomutase family protein [bacterium]|nr:phosphoglucomutase/phosphomannomutase family protein [bacterium]
MGKIKFGTDGWRAIVGEDFTKENVELVINAIGKYIKDNFGLTKKVLIGYDPRNMADEFSKLSAQILSSLGFTVLLSDRIVPTPVLAYSAKLLDACAIMFTASHNPPEYLGIKYIPDYAGPATDDITSQIVDNLEVNIEKNPGGKIIIYDFAVDYFNRMDQLVDFEKIKSSNKKFIYNGFYSATIGYFDEILKQHGIEFETINMVHDKNFGGKMPDPKPQYMQDLIDRIKSSDNAVGFANDGDGDRFGVVNENGEYVTPNEIISILLLHLVKNKGLEGSLVKTVGSSFLLNKTAQKLGIDVVETAVGFKHVGEAMRKFNPIIGGEESGGLSIQGHIPEKDGIIANLLILEAMAYENKSLVDLQKDLYNLVGCNFYNARIDKKVANTNEVQVVLEKYKSVQNIGEFSVKNIDTKDGVKLYFTDDSSWILIRPSGTEPLLRIYFESDTIEKLECLKSQF